MERSEQEHAHKSCAAGGLLGVAPGCSGSRDKGGGMEPGAEPGQGQHAGGNSREFCEHSSYKLIGNRHL